MKWDITYFIDGCDTCRQVKVEYQRPFENLELLPIQDWKWEDIDMDFMAELP